MSLRGTPKQTREFHLDCFGVPRKDEGEIFLNIHSMLECLCEVLRSNPGCVISGLPRPFGARNDKTKDLVT